MTKQKVGAIQMCVLIAKGILHTRSLRRKLGLQLIVVLLILFSLGVFVIGDWLEQHPWPFVIFWAVVFLLTAGLILLALIDALRVISEEQKEHNKEMAKDLRDIAKILKDEEDRKKGE